MPAGANSPLAGIVVLDFEPGLLGAVHWADLIRLLQIFAATGDTDKIEAFKAKMVFDRYAPYIDGRKVMRLRVIQPLQQLVLPL